MTDEPFENPQTIGLMPGPVKVDYKHVYFGVATPMRLKGGLEVVLLAKDFEALAEVFIRFGFGKCDFGRCHEAILGPKSKTTPA